MDEIKVYFGLLQAAHQQHDWRLVGRVANRLGGLRKGMSKELVGESLTMYSTHSQVNALFNAQPSTQQPSVLQECFVWLLAVKFLQDDSNFDLELCKLVIGQVIGFNLRELDPILARLLAALVKGAARNPASIHNDLMVWLKQCQWRHDRESTSVCHNGLARVYLLTGQWAMMDRLFASCQFPFDSASHNQAARHYYYAARLAAVKLDYWRAHEWVEQALRKAPSETGPFQLVCLKLFVVVKLLLGEIPDLVIFKKNPGLASYYALTRSVRNGDLPAFQGLLEPSSPTLNAFQEDALAGLILRLHQNVLKAGLKRISMAYSQIPVVDIQSKLGLSSTDDTLMIVMKAIRDGVISGQLISEGAIFCSIPESRDEAGKTDALHSRIVACQSLIRGAVKAMRFPAKPDSNKPPEPAPSVENMEDSEDILLMDEDFF